MTPSMTTSLPQGTSKPVSGAVAIGAGAPRRAPAISYSLWSYAIGIPATIAITGSLPRVMAMGRSSPFSSALRRCWATSCIGTGWKASRLVPMTWMR